jgi:uncharacterized membrane protein YgcG
MRGAPPHPQPQRLRAGADEESGEGCAEQGLVRGRGTLELEWVVPVASAACIVAPLGRTALRGAVSTETTGTPVSSRHPTPATSATTTPAVHVFVFLRFLKPKTVLFLSLTAVLTSTGSEFVVWICSFPIPPADPRSNLKRGAIGEAKKGEHPHAAFWSWEFEGGGGGGGGGGSGGVWEEEEVIVSMLEGGMLGREGIHLQGRGRLKGRLSWRTSLDL